MGAKRERERERKTAEDYGSYGRIVFSLGIRPRRIKSLLISREAHSPLAPLFPSPRLSIFQRSRSLSPSFFARLPSFLNFLRHFSRRDWLRPRRSGKQPTKCPSPFYPVLENARVKTWNLQNIRDPRSCAKRMRLL